MFCTALVKGLLFSLGLSFCEEPTTPSPFDAYDLVQGIKLHREVEETVVLVNTLLKPLGRLAVKASWQTVEQAQAQAADKVLTIYLAERKLPGINHVEYLRGKSNAVANVKSRLRAQVEHDDDETICEPLVHCESRPRETDPLITAVANVLATLYRTESAAAALSCQCIILMESDLEVFDRLFSFASDGERGADLSTYLTFMVLHEIGHLSGDYSIPTVLENESASLLLADALYNLSHRQLEEVRADLFAAALLKEACFLYNPELQGVDKSNLCIGQIAHGVEIMVTMMADSSRKGVCRRYLDPSDNYPNYALRTLLVGLVMAPDQFADSDLIKSQIEGRHQLLKAHPWVRIVEPMNCGNADRADLFFLGRSCVVCDSR